MGALNGTMSGMQVQSPRDAIEQQTQEMLAALAQQAAAAQQQAVGAGQEYQQAAAAPPPMLQGLAAFLPSLLSNVASVVGQNPQYAKQGQQQQESAQENLMEKRKSNLQALRDRYSTLAEHAGKLGNIEAEAQWRTKAAAIDRQHDQIMQKQKEDADMNLLREQVKAGRYAKKAATTEQQDNDSRAIAEAIERGDQPPDTKGLYKLAGPVRGHLARMGYDMSTAQKDWVATQRHFSSLNGPQQQRLRQAAQTAFESMDVIDELSTQLKGKIPRGKFPVFNKAAMVAAKNGLFGPEAQDLATQLDAQITDVTSEIGQVFRGGYAPTNEALKLAAKNLSGDWNDRTLKSMTQLGRKNLRIRLNSITNTEAITTSSQGAPSGASNDPLGVR